MRVVPTSMVPGSSTSQDAMGAGASSGSALVCGQLARMGSWMGQVTLSSWRGTPCRSNARPQSLHRPGGDVSPERWGPLIDWYHLKTPSPRRDDAATVSTLGPDRTRGADDA